MTTTSTKGDRKPSAAARAQAAAWIARLHGPNRTPHVESGLRRWLSEDPEHALAFELLTDTWEKSARLHRRTLEQVASWQWPGFRISFSGAALAAMAVAVVAVIGTVLALHHDGISTAVGEQRTETLQDGTRVFLNTDSRVIVHYDRQARRVELVHGEAFFEVAKRPDWPFIVTAGAEQVRALGTAFLVRRDPGELSVTLVEGKITVSPLDLGTTPGPNASIRNQNSSQSSPGPASEARALASVFGQAEATGEHVITLTPGERLIFEGTQAPHIDHPSLDAMIAWRRGQVVFDNTPLADAVDDMNRYAPVQLVVRDPRVAAIPISGIFRAGDSEDFAQAIARTYQLKLRTDSRVIVLAGSTAEPDGTGDAPK